MTDTTAMQQQLLDLVGEAAVHDYARLSDTEQRAARAWAADLPGLTESQLYDRAIAAVLAAADEEARRAIGEGWFRADACMYEARRRHLAAGHTHACRGDDAYGHAYREAVRRSGLGQLDPRLCTCGADTPATLDAQAKQTKG